MITTAISDISQRALTAFQGLIQRCYFVEVLNR